MGFLSAFNKKPAADKNRQPIEQLSALIASYLQRLETKGGTLEERSFTLIARSPSAAISQALALQSAEILRQQVTLKIIFARLASFEHLNAMVSSLSLTRPCNDKASTVRLIKTPALLHAHEQLILGTSCCWTGDMLRRNEENRNGLDIWEENAEGSVRLAQFAFNAIWDIAKPVPPRVLTSGGRVLKDSGQLTPAMAAAGLASSAELRRLVNSQVTRH